MAKRRREQSGGLQRSRIRWINGKSPLRFGFCGRPVPVQHEDPHERGMRFRKIRTQLQRVLCQLPRAFIAFRRVQHSHCPSSTKTFHASNAHAMP